MYLKEIKDKDTYESLIKGSCMNCGLVPKFTSEMNGNGVTIDISYKNNPGWTYLIDKDGVNFKISACYCPVCTRKMKLLKLKNRI